MQIWQNRPCVKRLTQVIHHYNHDIIEAEVPGVFLSQETLSKQRLSATDKRNQLVSNPYTGIDNSQT